MKLAAIADVHLGNHQVFSGPRRGGLNGRARLVLEALERARDLAGARGCGMLAVAGDLFDTSRPPPAHIAAVQDIFRHVHSYGVHVLCGNHDQTSATKGDNAIAPLAPVAKVHQSPAIVGPVCFVPFRNEPAEDYIRSALERVYRGPGQAEVLVVHAGVEDESTKPFLRGAHDSIHVDALEKLLKDCGFTCAIVGNWHHQQVWRRGEIEIAQCGALVPTGFDNPGIRGYGGFITWDSDKPAGQRVTAEQLIGPRFVSAGDADRLLMEIEDWPRELVYGQVKCPSSAVPQQLRAAGELGLAGVRVVASQASAKALAAKAVEGAQGGATQDEAIAAWVESMGVSGCSQREVLAEVRDLLAQAQG